ncbi:MAG: dioxygenase extradiol [Mycobacterium sp.]|jgi:aromatic ring-opening dioxygenase catalytic subunit (LigB family)|nr:dioxygenase extradiol [Mycobacterium sp.]
MPSLFLSHGAPPLVDDATWVAKPAPGMPYAHPTIEHFAPFFVALGALQDPEQAPKQVIDGFWMGLAKRSIQLV